jgi:PIN domain nuclease of toxin-antitoxin system
VKTYAIDTHAFVWHVSRPKRLGRHALRVLRDVDAGRAECWIPAVVAVELCLLREMRGIPVGHTEVESTTRANPAFRPLPLDFAQVAQFALLPVLDDPFDRLIVAAARALGCPLITSDAGISESGLVDVVWD